MSAMARCGSGFVLVAAVACASGSRPAADTSSVQSTSKTVEPVNVANALSLSEVLTADYVAAHGSCVSTAAAPARSRLLHILIPDQSSYLRLNVVTSADGSRPEMIDLARGAGGSRIWYATLDRGATSVRMETFVNQGDKHPNVAEVALGDPTGQRLEQLARAALSLPCSRG